MPPTLEEVVSQLESLSPNGNPEGFYTTAEWAELWGFESNTSVIKRLKAATKLGLVETSTKVVNKFGGGRQKVAAYKLNLKPRKGRKK